MREPSRIGRQTKSRRSCNRRQRGIGVANRPPAGRTTSSGRLLMIWSLNRSLFDCQANSEFQQLPTDDVSMRVDFVAEDLQLDLAGRDRWSEWLLDAQLEACCSPDLFQVYARVQTENFHSLGLLVIAQDGEVGNDSVRSGAGRQAGGFTGAGTGEISWRGQKIEPGHKTARVLVHYHQDAAAQRGEIIGAAAARQANARLGIVAADQRGIQIPIRVDLGAAQESVIHQA